MNSKNAYEIRLEILNLANSNVMSDYYTKIEQARMNAEAAGDKGGKCYDNVKFPTPETVIEHAKKLYTFVDGN